MAKLSKFIQALLHLEKEDPDKRRVLIYHTNRDEWLKVTKVYEDVEGLTGDNEPIVVLEAQWDGRE